MFTKILIANRGEIAVRILAACRELGIASVAVYSEADSTARHVREADEAYLIGPAPAAQSYLRIDAMLDVARRSGSQAIHPGYGFLSENAAFAEACEQAGIVFIGPSAQAMRVMGSKIAAKQLASSVAVATVPGYNGTSQDEQHLLHEARKVGFPLLIKASAGGGGKGMREVSAEADFLAQLAGARREALAAFGDETVFLERLILHPRHVEIQILADTHGHVLYLGERECSLQRRHQKIVEESPSVALTPALRASMGEAAVRIARAAEYVNAGTIEFILDREGTPYFLEMNTRLQVEHPVTELVTGLDLVRHQLLIAAGEPLSFTQEQVSLRGHALEVRLYAEDPAQHFLPSTGVISRFIQPTAPGIRLDSGVADGDEISQYYDPMIAKLITYAEDRPAAIARMQQALEQCAIFGVTTNSSLLHAIVRHPAFLAGQTHTNFLAEHDLLAQATEQQLPNAALLAAALYEHSHVSAPAQANPWKMLGPWRMIGEAYTIQYRYQERTYVVALKPAQANSWMVRVDNQEPEQVSVITRADGLVVLKRAAQQLRVWVQPQASEIQVMLAGHSYRLLRHLAPTVEQSARGSEISSTQKMLTAPMAGTIVKVQVRDGEHVQAQQVLVIVSAMKMEHAVIAPYEGIVRHVAYGEGAVVRGGAVLIEMV